MIIYLVGYMGVGKSTIGNALAEQRQYPFLDIDEIITSLEGKDINTIFKEMGEQYFRKLEKRVLSGLQHLTRAVIATGGGLPCFNNNMDILNASGITVYLKASVDFLANRLIQSTDRPIIEDNRVDLTKFISTHLAERTKYYEQASIVVKAEASIEEVVSAIQSQLE